MAIKSRSHYQSWECSNAESAVVVCMKGDPEAGAAKLWRDSGAFGWLMLVRRASHDSNSNEVKRPSVSVGLEGFRGTGLRPHALQPQKLVALQVFQVILHGIVRFIWIKRRNGRSWPSKIGGI